MAFGCVLLLQYVAIFFQNSFNRRLKFGDGCSTPIIARDLDPLEGLLRSGLCQ